MFGNVTALEGQGGLAREGGRARGTEGYLAHKKPPPPHRTAIGAQAWSHCRVLRGGGFL